MRELISLPMKKRLLIIGFSHMTHHFESGAQDAKFPEANVKGRTCKTSVRLFDHHHVYGASQCSSVNLIVEFAKIRYELSYIVHRIHVCEFILSLHFEKHC